MCNLDCLAHLFRVIIGASQAKWLKISIFLNHGYGSLLIIYVPSNFCFWNLISSMTLIISFGFFFFNGGEQFAILYKWRWRQPPRSGPKIVYQGLWKYPPCFHLPEKLLEVRRAACHYRDGAWHFGLINVLL